MCEHKPHMNRYWIFIAVYFIFIFERETVQSQLARVIDLIEIYYAQCATSMQLDCSFDVIYCGILVFNHTYILNIPVNLIHTQVK